MKCKNCGGEMGLLDKVCPYCGSESIYEIDGYYRCAECGNSIYDPDDLELGYVEGYMEMLVPISIYQ